MPFEGGRIFLRSGHFFVPKVALSILQARFLVKCRGHRSVSTSRAVPQEAFTLRSPYQRGICALSVSNRNLLDKEGNFNFF